MKNIFICGESWIGYTLHIKGADSFATTGYRENVRWLRTALEQGGYAVSYMPAHTALAEFPDTVQKLNQYDLLILSDIGAGTLLMTTPSFTQSVRAPNRCQAIKEYVLQGGSFLMIGGFLSFTGIEGKARFGATPIADILPVGLLPYDDRVETSEGSIPEIVEPTHPIFSGIDEEWPFFIGHNKTLEDPARGKVLARINGDPFIAAGQFGEGRSAVFTSDCAPHWAPPEFLTWKHYKTIWNNLAGWLTEARIGTFFGEDGIASGKPRNAHVIAREGVTCLVFSPGAPTGFAGRGEAARFLSDEGQPVGEPTQATHRIDVSDFISQKIAAIASYRTQYPITPEMFPQDILTDLMGHEYFLRIHPPPKMGATLD